MQFGLKETPPPTWLVDVKVPGEEAIAKQIKESRREIEAALSKVKDLEASLNEVKKYKGLLYQTGNALQEIVKTTLGELGAEIEPSTVTDEFIIKVGDKKMLAEVKGNTKSISKADLAQLITDLGEHLKATQEDVDGILIGNAWRRLPPDKRNTHDKPIFPRNVVKTAEKRTIGLLSSVDLFSAYCRSLSGEESQSDILRKIIEGKGLIRL